MAGCGAGKTQILLQAMAEIKQPSLWICHTYELLQQTKERALENLGLKEEETGIIAAGEVKLGQKLTLALIQTLSRLDLEKLSGHFGAVFVDEAHHLAAGGRKVGLDELAAAIGEEDLEHIYELLEIVKTSGCHLNWGGGRRFI